MRAHDEQTAAAAKAAASRVRAPVEGGRSSAALALQRAAGNAATTMAIQRFSMDDWDDMGIFSGSGQDQSENTGAIPMGGAGGGGMDQSGGVSDLWGGESTTDGTQGGGWDGNQGGVGGGNAGYLAGMDMQVRGRMTRIVNGGRGPDAPSGAQGGGAGGTAGAVPAGGAAGGGAGGAAGAVPADGNLDGGQEAADAYPDMFEDTDW